MTDPTQSAAEPASSTLLTDPPAAADPAPADPAPAADPAAPTEDQKPADEAKPAEPEGAPEAYEFVQPEGHVVDESVISKFSEVAKELNLSQEKAQRFLDAMAPAVAAAQAESYKEMFSDIGGLPETWGNAARADKEFGGDQLEANLAIANKAYDQFATNELKTLLAKTKFGDHPEIIRMFYRIGKSVSPDAVITGKAAPTPTDRLATLYDNTPKS